MTNRDKQGTKKTGQKPVFFIRTRTHTAIDYRVVEPEPDSRTEGIVTSKGFGRLSFRKRETKAIITYKRRTS